MKILKSKMGLRAVSIYLLLVIIAWLIFYLGRDEGPFAGVYIFALTAPWSFIVTSILDSRGKLSSISLLTMGLIDIGFVIMNAFIIYWLAKRNEIHRKIYEDSQKGI